MGYKLDDAIEIFESIKNVSGRLDKEKILKENKNNELFRSMLDFLYNPFITTGLSAKKFNKDVGAVNYEVAYKGMISNITEAMNYLKQNNTGKDKNIKEIQEYINNIVPYHAEFLEQFFTKEYKCGITAKTINKVYGKGTIPIFEIMLAESLEEHLDYIEGEEYLALLKYDGVRCTAIKQDGATTFLTRKGHPILEMVELEQDFKHLTDGMVYEGELVVSNYRELNSKECYKKTSKIVRTDGEKKGLIFMAFDILPLDEFNNGRSSLGYEQRYDALCQEFLNIDIINNLTDNLKVAHLYYSGKDISIALDLSNKAIENNQEGIVVRKANAPYVTKRSKDLLRIKAVQTADLRVIGYEEGTKESTKGKLGALVVNYKGFRVKVGSGFKPEERVELWEKRDDLIGKIIEVYYSEETSNDKGGLSLRFPRFKGVRFDKDEADFEGSEF